MLPSVSDAIKDKINEIIVNRIDTAIDGTVDMIYEKLINTYISLIDVTTSVVAVGMVGFIFYQLIKYMFFEKEEDMQKVMFGYFMFLLIRIFSSVLVFKIS